MSESILHPPEGAAPAEQPAESIIEKAAARSEKKLAALDKARKASAASRKAKAERKRQRRETHNPVTAEQGAAGGADDALSAALRKEFAAAPVTSAKELAKFIAATEESLLAVAPIAGEKGLYLVRALQWSDGKGNPSPQCTMAAGFMWPWLKRHDAFGKLANEFDSLMFAAGCTILFAPFLGTIASLFLRRPQMLPQEQPQDAAQMQQPRAVA